MDQLKSIKEQLINQVQGQLGHLETVDAKELGEVVDMIKDLAETAYYCSITEAMEESAKEGRHGNTYYYTMPYNDYDRGRMYYGGSQGSGSYNGGNGGSSNDNGGMSGGNRMYTPTYSMNRRMYPEMYAPEMPREYEYMPEMMMNDPREGRAKQSRRMYMESKEMHKDSATQMRELEKYIQDLGEDVTEMIKNATSEEKQVLKQKIATLSTKIV